MLLKQDIMCMYIVILFYRLSVSYNYSISSASTIYVCTLFSTQVLIIGAGPCGLRAAIEAQLLGAKVVVLEKRDRFSRNNVLHLWPFVIHDLRNLGAKKFFGKFCAGSIDHISKCNKKEFLFYSKNSI